MHGKHGNYWPENISVLKNIWRFGNKFRRLIWVVNCFTARSGKLFLCTKNPVSGGTKIAAESVWSVVGKIIVCCLKMTSWEPLGNFLISWGFYLTNITKLNMFIKKIREGENTMLITKPKLRRKMSNELNKHLWWSCLVPQLIGPHQIGLVRCLHWIQLNRTIARGGDLE